MGVEIDDIGLRRPTLDDVFLSLTGHVAEREAEENGGSGGESRPGGGRDGERVKEAAE